MTTNNQYIKTIAESLVGSISGTHSDNYYLKRIAEFCGYTYTGTVCNGKLYKDIVENITQTTITGTHFNNYFLKRWAEIVSGETYDTELDNYYLGIIAHNPFPGRVTTMITIDPNETDLVYGDDFNITGTLTKRDLTTPIPDEPVYLKVGDTIVGSPQTTDSNGKVSFTYAPVTTGNHSFQLVFNGNVQYSSSFSSVMNKTAQKETVILNVDSPMNNSVWTDDGRIWIRGVLFDDDTPTANPIPNRRVNMRMTWINKRGSESFSSTFTQTTSRGDFIVEMSLPSYEDMSDTNKQCTLTVTHPESDNYASASTSIVLNIVKPHVSLVSDKSILSYADSDVATLTATLHAYDNRDKTVTFYKVTSQGDEVVLGTGTTDRNGQCSYNYNSQGVGDLYVKAISGSLVSETYTIEDCHYYNSNTYSSSSISNPILNIPLTSDCSIEWEAMLHSSSSINMTLRIGLDNTSNFVWGGITGNRIYQLWTYDNGRYTEQLESSSSMPVNTWSNEQILIENGVVKYHGLNSTSNRSFNLEKLVSIVLQQSSIRNIKIKPL